MRMDRAMALALLFLLLFAYASVAFAANEDLCRVRTLAANFFDLDLDFDFDAGLGFDLDPAVLGRGPGFKCHHPSPPLLPRVAELNEVALKRALELLRSGNITLVAVLFHAKWCPFSKSFHPIFKALSSTFPSIYHVSVEESLIRPSVLSQFGIHSFPSIFLYNRSVQMRYRGSRALEDLIAFYKNMTGLQPLGKGSLEREEIEGLINTITDGAGGIGKKESCPYPWAMSPEKWLHEDTYLLLAVSFCIGRLAYFLLKMGVSRMSWRRLRRRPLASLFRRSFCALS